MTDTTTVHTGAPKQFGLTVPGWWPRIEPVFDIGDQVPDELGPEAAEAIQELAGSVDPHDGTRLISVIMSAEDEPRPFGVMYVHHSEKAGTIMSKLLGIEATPNDLADLNSVGKLKDVEVSVKHFDTVGAVSCVMARRQAASGYSSLLHAYLIPQPQTLQAVLIVYITPYHELFPEPFAELFDDITSTFTWRW